MTCQQSFYRMPILRPIGTSSTERPVGDTASHPSYELPRDRGTTNIWPWFTSHPSFEVPANSKYSSDLYSVGWEGGPSTASIFFRKGFSKQYHDGDPRDDDAYCPSYANCFTAYVTARRKSFSPVQDRFLLPADEAADGVVTVKAFFYNKDNLQQRSDGIFLRMTTTVEPFAVPSLQDSIPLYGGWGEEYSNLGLFVGGQKEVSRRQNLVIQGKPSGIVSYLDDESLYESRAAMHYLGDFISPLKTTMLRGRIYHQVLHTFEFGKITSGSLSVEQTQHQVDCANRFLTLGMDRRSAFACVGSDPRNQDLGLYSAFIVNIPSAYNPGTLMLNGFVPRVVFSPIVINENLGSEFERYRTLEGLDKHPLRFEIETTSASKTLLLDSGSRSGPPISVRLPNLTAIPFEGREVHDIRSRVATSTSAARAASFEPHEQYCFLEAMTAAAQYKAAEVSYWPGLQSQTDIAIPVGSAAYSSGSQATLTISMTHDASRKDAAQRAAEYVVQQELRYDLRQRVGTVPRWPASVPLGSEVSGLPSVPDNFDSMLDSAGRSIYNWNIYPVSETSYYPAGDLLGYFGDLTVELKQQTPDNKTTPSQWRGVSTTRVRTPELTTGADPQVYTTTFVLRTSDVLWPEWRQKLYDGSVTDWNTLWTPGDIDNPEMGSDGVVRPYKPFNNRNAITSFVTDEVVLFGRLGEDFTRFHFVDEHEAAKQGDINLKGIPPGPDASGKSFTQRWSEAKEQFRQAVRAAWTRCGDFSEAVQVSMYSELRSLEARAQFILNAEHYNSGPPTRNTGEAGPLPYPVWNRLRVGANFNGTGTVTADDPMLRFGLFGNVCDVTKIDVYAADVSFGEPTEELVDGHLWRGFEGLRDTPHIRKYSVPCTVTFFATKKTPTKVYEIYRAVGSSGLDIGEFKMSSDTGDLYQINPAFLFQNLRRHGATSFAASWG
jgi:hypothetical protein